MQWASRPSRTRVRRRQVPKRVANSDTNSRHAVKVLAVGSYDEKVITNACQTVVASRLKLTAIDSDSSVERVHLGAIPGAGTQVAHRACFAGK